MDVYQQILKPMYQHCFENKSLFTAVLWVAVYHPNSYTDFGHHKFISDGLRISFDYRHRQLEVLIHDQGQRQGFLVYFVDDGGSVMTHVPGDWEQHVQNELYPVARDHPRQIG